MSFNSPKSLHVFTFSAVADFVEETRNVMGEIHTDVFVPKPKFGVSLNDLLCSVQQQPCQAGQTPNTCSQ